MDSGSAARGAVGRPFVSARLIFATGSLYLLDSAQCFALAAEAGFDGAEIMCDARWFTHDPEYLASLAERHRLPVLVVHTPFSERTPGWSQGGDQVRRIEQTLWLAETLGAEAIVVHLPERLWLRRYRLLGRTVLVPQPGRFGTVKRWIEQQLPQVQARTRVKIAVENLPSKRVFGWVMPHIWWNTVAEWSRVHDHLTLDTTHLGDPRPRSDRRLPRGWAAGRQRPPEQLRRSRASPAAAWPARPWRAAAGDGVRRVRRNDQRRAAPRCAGVPGRSGPAAQPARDRHILPGTPGNTGDSASELNRLNHVLSCALGMRRTMKRHPGLVPLSHEHRQILFVAQVLKRGIPRFRDAPATVSAKWLYAREQRDRLLVPHQRREEQRLFPPARAAGLAELVEALVVQHEAIGVQLAALEGLEAEGPEAEARLDALGHLLEAHVRTEERELFPRLQALLPDAALLAIGADWSEASGLSCLPEP